VILNTSTSCAWNPPPPPPHFIVSGAMGFGVLCQPGRHPRMMMNTQGASPIKGVKVTRSSTPRPYGDALAILPSGLSARSPRGGLLGSGRGEALSCQMSTVNGQPCLPAEVDGAVSREKPSARGRGCAELAYITSEAGTSP